MSYSYLPVPKPVMRVNRSQWLIFLLLSVSLFFVFHWPLGPVRPLGDYNDSQDLLITGVEAGSQVRQVVLIALGLLSLVSILREPAKNYLQVNGSLGWGLLSFGAWSFLSVVWAEDKALTIKRLVVFGILCLLSTAFVRRFSLRQLRLWILANMTLFVLIALAVELASGSFKPFATGYRFSGIQHPNAEGVDCALLFMSALMTWRKEQRLRWVSGSLAFAGLVLMLLTASRTALGATMFAIALYATVVSSRERRVKVAPVLVMIACCAILFVSSGRSLGFKNAIALGRDDGNDIESFTGRTTIWSDVGAYIRERPLVGHGFEGFWTPKHIATISDKEQWGVPDSHSTYVDYLLTLGIVGLALYLFSLVNGLRRALVCFVQTKDLDFVFLASLLAFCFLNGFLESALGDASLLMLIAMLPLVRLAFAVSGSGRPVPVPGRRGQRVAYSS